MTSVFYIPGQTAVIDYARQLSTGAWVCHNGGLTHAQLLRQYPGVVLGELEGFLAHQDRAHCTEPREVTSKHFDLALRQRRTIDFNSDASGESFKLDEQHDGNMATIYLRTGDRCWIFQGVATLPHQVIVQRVAQLRHRRSSTR